MRMPELDGRATSEGPPGSTRRDTSKRDDAPRGVFRPRPGLWAVRFTCSCGRIHEETIGRIKKDAVDAYYARRNRLKDEPGWCPKRDKRVPAPAFRDYARDFISWAKH